MYLVSLGLIKEVNPEKKDDVFVSDIDHTINPSEMCFRWSGFNHPSSEITFQLGVGLAADPDNADFISYETVSNTVDQHCFDVSGLVHLTQYFGLLTATIDSGVVKQSSDGMYYIDSETELATAQVHDGEGCFHARTIVSMDIGPLNAGTSISHDVQTMLGLWYTVELIVTDNDDIPQVGPIPEIVMNFDGIDIAATQIFHEPDGRRHVYASIFSEKASYTVTITNNFGFRIVVEQLDVKLCTFDTEYHGSINTADVWWNFYFEAKLRPQITSFLVALQEIGADEETLVAGWDNAFLQSQYKFSLINLLPGM